MSCNFHLYFAGLLYLMKNISMGWISIDRSIREHWIWSDAEKLKWWLDILMSVNHTDAEVLIGQDVISCKRGQSVMSLDSWARRWKVNKSKVRRFLLLLQKCNMVCTESVQKSTRLTVCNYDSYQGERNDTETIVKRKRNDSETIMTPNNNKENNKEEISTSLRQLCLDYHKQNPDKYPNDFYKDFIEYWTTPIQEKGKNFGKELWRAEKTFNIGMRLKTSYAMVWEKKNKVVNKVVTKMANQ